MMDNNDLKSKKILVLMGGLNEESEVSRKSGASVLKSLLENGYNAIGLEFDLQFIEKISQIRPQIVFIALHGKFGEDGRIQSLLDFLQLPYTHSSFLPCSISMDKIISLKLAQSMGVEIPRGNVLEKGSKDNYKKIAEIGYPAIIKPINSGSSVGVEIIANKNSFDIEDYDWKYGDKILVEEYIYGKDIQVAVMNGTAIGAIEINPKNKFYNYESKYTKGMSEYIMPANLPADSYKRVLKIAQDVHNDFGCEGISRIDFMYDPTIDKFYFLEINTHPGLTENSLLPKIAEYYGISFIEIIEYLLKTAKCNF